MRQSYIAMTGFVLPRGRVHANAVEIDGAVDHVGVRILFVGDDRRRRIEHRLRNVSVEVEFDADRDVRPDDLAATREDVAFAIVVAFGGHGAVQVEQHHVERQRFSDAAQEFVAERLVDGAHGAPAGFRDGGDAFDRGMAVGPGELAPSNQRMRTPTSIRTALASPR